MPLNSRCTVGKYKTAAAYIKVLKAVRKELDGHPDLREIRIMGPEDLIGGGWSMWNTGGGADQAERGLRIINELAKDPTALAALSFFNVHGYGRDGVIAGGANSTQWDCTNADQLTKRRYYGTKAAMLPLGSTGIDVRYRRLGARMVEASSTRATKGSKGFH